MKWSSRAARCLVGAVVVAACRDSAALPSGRAWTPASTLTLPGFYYLAAPRVDVDSAGRVTLIAITERVGPGDDLAGFVWDGTNWSLQWKLGEGTLAPWPVISPPGTHYLVWGGGEDSNTTVLSLARIFAGGIAQPETITLTAGARTEYSAAVGPRRRWAAVGDLAPGLPFTRKLRAFYSDTAKLWREVAVEGEGDYGVAVTAVDDTTALVAWTSLREGQQYGMRWATLQGARWVYGGSLPGGDIPSRPRFRRRPSGGLWLAWGTSRPEVYLATYHDGVWSEAQALPCAYREGPYSQHLSSDPDLSRDDAELPVIVWDAQFFGGSRVCVCVPTDSGYGVAESLEDVPGGVLPSVARDRNGDVWVAWWEEFGPLRWQHSYTSAMASAPRVIGAGRHRALAWSLSETAPGSWWTVQRSGGHARAQPGAPRGESGADGSFEDVARVRAGEGSDLSWVDDSPPGGVLRYRIRRDCVDKRYEWLSDEATWPPQVRKPRAVRLAARGASDGNELELEGAAPGTLDVRVYDVQGRLVHRQREVTTEGESKVFRLGLGMQGATLRSGIYFIRVRDALGQESNAVKTVLLR